MFDETEKNETKKKDFYDDFSETPETIKISHTGKKPLDFRLINKVVRTKYRSEKNKLNEYNLEIQKFTKDNNIEESKGITSLILIGLFLKLVKKYINVEFIHTNENIGFTCKNCSSLIDDTNDLKEEGLFVCKECFCENTKPIISKITKENNISLQPEYISSFRKTISKFSGNEYCVEEGFYKAIDEYLKRNNKKNFTRDYIYEKADHDEFGIVKNTSRSLLLSILTFIENNKKFSKDINEILKTYWNWKIPDINEMSNNILDLDIELFKFWNGYKNKEEFKVREAFLGNQFRLFVELKTLGIKVHKDFFDLQENRKSLEFHKKIWNEFCIFKNIKDVLVDV